MSPCELQSRRDCELTEPGYSSSTEFLEFALIVYVPQVVDGLRAPPVCQTDFEPSSLGHDVIDFALLEAVCCSSAW